MPVMSAKLTDALVTIERLKSKWGMAFDEFKGKIKNNTLEKDAYSFDTETDFWEWEEAETLREHYTDIKNQWM